MQRNEDSLGRPKKRSGEGEDILQRKNSKRSKGEEESRPASPIRSLRDFDETDSISPMQREEKRLSCICCILEENCMQLVPMELQEGLRIDVAEVPCKRSNRPHVNTHISLVWNRMEVGESCLPPPTHFFNFTWYFV